MKKFSLGVMLLTLMIGSAQAANTVQDFSAIFEDDGPGGNAPDFLPIVTGATEPMEIIDAWDGNALIVTQELNSQNAGFSLNQEISGPFDNLEFSFDFSISPGNGGGADGMAFAWVNSDVWGANNASPAPTWGPAEEPNLAGSLGVGFDTFNNEDQGDGGEQSISLHFDGARLDSIPMDEEFVGEEFLESGDVLKANISVTPAVGGANVSVLLENTDSGDEFEAYDNFFVDGMTLYDGRVGMLARTGGANSEQTVDNIRVAGMVTGGDAVEVIQDFESFEEGIIEVETPPAPPLEELVGGTPFSRNDDNRGSDPPAQLIPAVDEVGPQEAHLQLTTTVQSQGNSIAFDQTSDVADQITARFDFKIDDSGNNADGMSFIILDAGIDGEEGPIGAVSEEPNLAGALGVGFDTFDNNEEEGIADRDLGNRANHFSLHYDGSIIGDIVWFDPDEFDLVNGEWNTVTLTANETDDGLVVSMSVRDADGNEFSVFSDEMIDDASFPDGARAAFSARTGGASSVQSIDNVLISWTAGDGIPCDFDGSGQLDVGDIDRMLVAVGSGNNNATFDITGDGLVNTDDIVALVEGEDKFNTYIGDSNLDGEFNSSDFVDLFTQGEYEDGVVGNSTWSSGDWNGDAEFDSSDFVFAFTSGGYEQGPRAAAAAVPEPSSALLLVLGGLACLRRRK